MSRIEQMSIALPTDLANTIRAAIDAGDFSVPSEVVCEALCLWQVARAERDLRLQSLRAEIAKGEAGPFVDGEEAFARLLQRFAGDAAAEKAA